MNTLHSNCPPLNYCLFFLICAFSGFYAHSQTANLVFWEPEFSVSFDNGEKWGHSFGIANRALLSETFDGEEISDFTNEHIELNHFTKYRSGTNSAISLGVRYRFREIFNDSRYDELRFVEQFSVSHPNSSIGLGHRFRVEQRLRNVETIHRFRYRLGGSQGLGDNFSLGLSTEALYSISVKSKPSLEQRFTLEISNTSFRNLELSTGLDYQMANYNNNLENEFFILTGVALDLE